MWPRFLLVAGAVGLLGLSACASTEAPPGTARPAASSSQPGRGGAGTVILGRELWARGGNLLDALAGRASTLRVNRRAGGGCPAVMMRGQRTVLGDASAQVYVDGTPMVDTCILRQIRVLDVARVELYPGGAAGRSGYRAGPNGVILIFLTGPDAAH